MCNQSQVESKILEAGHSDTLDQSPEAEGNCLTCSSSLLIFNQTIDCLLSRFIFSFVDSVSLSQATALQLKCSNFIAVKSFDENREEQSFLVVVLQSLFLKLIITIDLFRLYILFSQYRSCDDTQET